MSTSPTKPSSNQRGSAGAPGYLIEDHEPADQPGDDEIDATADADE